MPDADADRSAPTRCQARPRAARPAYREDMLCASLASTVVRFHGVEVPVCRIHDAKYARWGADAEAQAELQWAWTPPDAQADELTDVPHLTPTMI
jgi:hypothetical protein